MTPSVTRISANNEIYELRVGRRRDQKSNKRTLERILRPFFGPVAGLELFEDRKLCFLSFFKAEGP